MRKLREVSQAEPETEVKRGRSRRRKCEKRRLLKYKGYWKEIEAELEKQAAELEKQEKEKAGRKRKGRKKEAASVKEEDAARRI